MTNLNEAQQKALSTYMNSYDTPDKPGAIVMITAHNFNSLLIDFQHKVLSGYKVHGEHPQCTTNLYLFKPAEQRDTEIVALLAPLADAAA